MWWRCCRHHRAPRLRPVASSISRSVSGAEPVLSARVSHDALAARCAVHDGGASRCEVEMTSAAESAALPVDAESTTRDGVTSITLAGGASKSFPTLQPMMMSATAREASLPFCIRMSVHSREHVPYPMSRQCDGVMSRADVLRRRNGWRGDATRGENLAKIATREQRRSSGDGSRYDRGASAGRYSERCVHPGGGWEAPALGRGWPVLRRLGDLSYERIARGSRTVIRVAVERLVRAGHPAVL